MDAADGLFGSHRPRSDSFAVFLKGFHLFQSDELQRTQVPFRGPQYLERETPKRRLDRAFHRSSNESSGIDGSMSSDPLDSSRLQFCEMLLDRYGNFSHVLNLLTRKGRMSEAVAYWREKMLSADVFVSGLVEPARKAGSCNELASAICSIAKPLLETVSSDGCVLKAAEDYDSNLLRATLAGCRHLKQKRAFAPLCTMYLAIGDDLRGGLSKLDLFSKGGRQSASADTRRTWLAEAVLAIERGLPVLSRLRKGLDPDVFEYCFSVLSLLFSRGLNRTFTGTTILKTSISNFTSI
jgi:hypothetical protein